MDKLLKYINSLLPAEREEFAAVCGTSVGYLRKAVSIGQRLGIGLCIRIEHASSGTVTCEDLRHDTDWTFLRTGTTSKGTACLSN